MWKSVEKLVEKKEYTEMVYVIERVCGICSFGHGWGYCASVEKAMGIEIPARANYLRTIWHELSRVHSHLLWLGLLADGFAFDSLFFHIWKLRESVLDLFEKTTGGRVIFFDTVLYNARYIVEGAYIVETSTNIFWSPYEDVHFRVATEQEYDEYGVYLNNERIYPAADGTYTIPANTGDAHIRMVGFDNEDTGDGEGGNVLLCDINEEALIEKTKEINDTCIYTWVETKTTFVWTNS